MTELEAMKIFKGREQGENNGVPAGLDRSRWEGCSACDSKCCELCVYQHFGGDDWPCNMCRDGFTEYKPVNYCSVCGRPLTEEAWAELAMRIQVPPPPNEPLTLEQLREIVEQLEWCGFQCEGGPLSGNKAFIRLKEFAYRRRPEEVAPHD